ncbi:MAG: hypothetical protein R6V44_09685 [Paracoccaceae bacterium]
MATIKGAADVKGTVNIQSESTINTEIRDAADVNNLNIVHNPRTNSRNIDASNKTIHGCNPRIYGKHPRHIHICSKPEIVCGSGTDCDWRLFPIASDGRKIYRDMHGQRILLDNGEDPGVSKLRCAISRQHCTLKYLEGGYIEVMDGTHQQNSKRGVFVKNDAQAETWRRADSGSDRNRLPLAIRLGKSRDPDQCVKIRAYPINLNSTQYAICLLRDHPAFNELFIWNPTAPDVHFINPDGDILLPTWFKQESLYSIKRTEIGYSWIPNEPKTLVSKTSLYENCRIETTQGTKLTVTRCRPDLLTLKIAH